MPIYEYYCPACDGRFRHLARRIDAPPPPCPRCGATEAERLVAAANVIRSGAHHERQLRETATQVDDDPRAIAHFLQDSGRLADADGVYGTPAYRELLARRAEGATDADVTDLVADLTSAMRASEAGQMAGAVMFTDQVENRMQAEGPPEDHEHGTTEATDKTGIASGNETSGAHRRAAKDLGWG